MDVLPTEAKNGAHHCPACNPVSTTVVPLTSKILPAIKGWIRGRYFCHPQQGPTLSMSTSSSGLSMSPSIPPSHCLGAHRHPYSTQCDNWSQAVTARTPRPRAQASQGHTSGSPPWLGLSLEVTGLAERRESFQAGKK